jgi:DNA-directed RNA polymerase specialized sigma24 family protein
LWPSAAEPAWHRRKFNNAGLPDRDAGVREALAHYCGRFDPFNAEDVAQDALVIAWRRFNRYDDTRPILGWLCCIARSEWINKRRTRWAQFEAAAIPLLYEVVIEDPSACDPLHHAIERDEQERKRDILMNAIDSLKPHLRSVVLRSFDESTAITDPQDLQNLKYARQLLKKAIHAQQAADQLF